MTSKATEITASPGSAAARRRFLAPLALAQFICSFAGSNMNVMINDISHDLDTTVQGVQTTITLFVLILGNSIFEGVGTALLIPPVYILTTMAFDDVASRARAFGVISGLGGVGA